MSVPLTEKQIQRRKKRGEKLFKILADYLNDTTMALVTELIDIEIILERESGR